MGSFGLLIALVAGALLGFGAAWFIRQDALTRAANFASSLEQLIAGLMRERDSLLEKERGLRQQLASGDQSLASKVAELEKELTHRETQAIAFRDEAIQLARAREELAQRLEMTESGARELERALTERIHELLEQSAPRAPGQRLTGAEREMAALMAAHENDLAELEARYLMLVQSKDAEIERLRAVRASQAVPVIADPAPEAAPAAVPATPTNGSTPEAAAPAPAPSRSRRNRRKSHDDLKQITGIDDSLEQALHLVGITSFKQVARWKDKDVERMAKRLYQPVERIRDEQWVERAREAHQKKYGRAP
ncbi:MAG: hypothetical protein U0133_16480 [Gemmatimonadales bacterium]